VTTTRVYPKGGSWYYVEDLAERNPRTGRPRQKWHKLCRIDAGEAALHQALAELHGKPPERGDMRMLIAEFRKVHFSTLSLGVRKEYERMFDVIGTAFADFHAAEVEPGDVLDFLNNNFSEKRTARRAYKARLSTFFGWCVLNKARTGVVVNPCREIKLRQPPKRKGKMNAAVYWAMHDALPESGRLFLELTYLTRQRPTETRLLRESAVLVDRIRFVPSKTEASSGEQIETVRSPRIDKILARLRALRAERTKTRKVVPLNEDPYLLVSEDGEPFTKSGLNSVWRRARAAAGVGKVTTRDIRPYALSQMEEAGHPVEAIREAAAHTTTAQTDGYLNQHRERFSRIVLKAPRRPK
jgi:integrase